MFIAVCIADVASVELSPYVALSIVAYMIVLVGMSPSTPTLPCHTIRLLAGIRATASVVVEVLVKELVEDVEVLVVVDDVVWVVEEIMDTELVEVETEAEVLVVVGAVVVELSAVRFITVYCSTLPTSWAVEGLLRTSAWPS